MFGPAELRFWLYVLTSEQEVDLRWLNLCAVWNVLLDFLPAEEAAEILTEDLDERCWKWNISGAAGGICVPCSVGVCSVMED